jgi:sulfate transport system ATP-binding protein
VPAAAPGTVEATLVQALTVGPNTRLEFRRSADQSFVDVEMARSDWMALRDRLGLAPARRCTSAAQGHAFRRRGRRLRTRRR